MYDQLGVKTVYSGHQLCPGLIIRVASILALVLVRKYDRLCFWLLFCFFFFFFFFVFFFVFFFFLHGLASLSLLVLLWSECQAVPWLLPANSELGSL